MAATTESFNSILKRYTPYKLHFETLKKTNWFVDWVEKKTDWMGSTMEIPFQASAASSFQWGALTASNDISEGQYLMGTLTNSDLKELWGSFIINNKDLTRHGGNMEASYLKILPNLLNRFTEKMSEKVSITYFNDGAIDVATANGTAGGIITVQYPHRFELGEKVTIDDDDSSPVSGYVVAINVNTKQLHIQDARTGGANVDLSGYTVAQNAKIYTPGIADVPQSLKSILLPASAGGVASYFGYTKATYPALQALAVDGSGFTKATLLDDLYSAYYQVLDQGKGSLNKIMVMPLKFMQHISAGLENNKRYTMETKKVAYGMRHVSITGVDGVAEFIAIRDCDPSLVYILDKEGMCLAGNSFFKRDTDANGNDFTVIRNTTGKVNIVDTAFFAALVVQAPSHQGIVYNIPRTLA